jgi:hypothetical protein
MAEQPPLPRPALARVLAALTSRPVGHWLAELASPAFRAETLRVDARGVAWRVQPDPYRHVFQARGSAWSVQDPAAAWETLATREVIPAEAVGAEGRGFPCETCQGAGVLPAAVGPLRVQCPYCAGECPTCGGAGRVLPAWSADRDVICDDCGGDGFEKDESPGFFPRPETLLAAASFASLGWEAVQTAEQLAREVAARVTWGAVRCERVLWRVGGSPEDIARERLQRHAFPESLPFAALFEWGGGAAVGNASMSSPLVEAMGAVWAMGLAVDRVAPSAVTLVCPAIGGGRG